MNTSEENINLIERALKVAFTTMSCLLARDSIDNPEAVSMVENTIGRVAEGITALTGETVTPATMGAVFDWAIADSIEWHRQKILKDQGPEALEAYDQFVADVKSGQS
jgi:hypothetical protein